jgi:hypothetical protein
LQVGTTHDLQYQIQSRPASGNHPADATAINIQPDHWSAGRSCNGRQQIEDLRIRGCIDDHVALCQFVWCSAHRSIAFVVSPFTRRSAASRKMNFTKEDAVDDRQLNEIIWRSVRGTDSGMPAPTRAAFVRAQARKDDDD